MRRSLLIGLAAVLAIAAVDAARAGEQPAQQNPRRGTMAMWGRVINVSEEFAVKWLPADAWITTETDNGKVTVDPRPNTCTLSTGEEGGTASLETNARGSAEAYEIQLATRVRIGQKLGADAAGQFQFGLASDDPAKAAILVQNKGDNLIVRIIGGAKDDTITLGPLDTEWHDYDFRVTKEAITLDVDGNEVVNIQAAPTMEALAALFRVDHKIDAQMDVDRVRLTLAPPGMRNRNRQPGGAAGGGGNRRGGGNRQPQAGN